MAAPARFLVAITTYNRPEMLRRLLRQLRHEQGSHELEILVYDDAGHDSLPDNDPALAGVQVHRFGRNHGKAGFWQLISRILADAAMSRADYLVMLQDDAGVVPGFFDTARRTWEGINDTRKAALFMLRDRQREGQAAWTGFKPVDRRHGRLVVTQTQWTDCMFFAGRARFLSLVPSIKPVERLPGVQSSGVGRQISLRLHEGGYTIYQPKRTLVTHGRHESVMHGEVRRHQPLTA